MTDKKIMSQLANNESIKDIEAELAVLQKKSEEYLNGWKRAKADYLNFKKETEKRQGQVIQFANAALLAELLPIIDHFKLAYQHVPLEVTEQEWVKGFGYIKNQFEDFLKNLGIESIKTVGEKFNPQLHEAASHEENPDFATDTIFEEVQPGYTLDGQVLRPAKVKVTK